MFSNSVFRTAAGSLVLLGLLAVPAMAGSGVIDNGIDIWYTPGDGTSWENFESDPIPADFFCSGSEAFTGQIVWKGAPLVTSPPDALGSADTIIRRLDDAVFDRQGVAETRIQFAALSLVSVQPIRTSCGFFDARATLAAGEQPVTNMRIVRDRKGGGYFEAPLALQARLSFTPVQRRSSRRLEIVRTVTFLPEGEFLWSRQPREGDALKLKGFVLVDTDGDRQADTFIPGTSRNFFPNGPAARSLQTPDKAVTGCQGGCHAGDTSCHCSGPVPSETTF